MTQVEQDRADAVPSAVPDVLAPGLRAVFCGINPGRRSAAVGHHFANPRNDFWRLLHEAGFTPRLFEPSDQWELLRHGFGLTNAAHRTTAGSGDLRRADFEGARERLERIAGGLQPGVIAFVGKEAYRGAFGQRTALGAATAPARRDAPVRPAFDFSRERRSPIRRAAPMVRGAGGACPRLD